MRIGTAETVEVTYRSPEWYEARRAGISASEIAAILGLSPYTSPFDLWWLKRTGEDSQPEDRDMARGRRWEPLIIGEFNDQHPELVTVNVGLVRHADRPWQMATPDAVAYETTAASEPVAVVEAKTGATRNEWGDPGTDAIPNHYRAQVLWQMDTLGLTVAYVPVLFGFDYREYVIEYDADDAAFMRGMAEAFMASVAANVQPEIDAASATTRRLKFLHSTIEAGEVEVAGPVVAQYRAAKRLRDAAEARMRLAENRIRAALGPNNVATVDGRKVASRSVYDVKERTQTVGAHTVNRLNITRERNASSP